MAINQRLLIIGSTDISNISEYSVEYNKLWKDADRNMNGDVRATLIGVFPKIKVKTTVQTRGLVGTLGNLLNKAYMSVTFYDPLSGTTKTANYYANDYSVKLIERERELFDEISFNLIPVSKRS